MTIKLITAYENVKHELQQSGARLFQNRYYSTGKANAQDNLRGVSHYVDDSTLRYFKSRICDATEIMDGLFFKIVESVALDMHNTERGYRVVVFDVFGEIVERASLDDCYKTRKQAERNFHFLLDVQAYYAKRLRELGQIEYQSAKRKFAAANALEV